LPVDVYNLKNKNNYFLHLCTTSFTCIQRMRIFVFEFIH